jgi:hypothetical protein
MLSLLTIAATAFGAYLGAPWWIILLGGAVLFLQSNTIVGARGERLRATGSRMLVAEATAICLGNTLLAGGSAFALGHLTRLTFGT